MNFGPTEASKAIKGPGRDSPEAIALGAWAKQYGADIGEMARQWCDDVPVAWIKVLFQRKVVGQPAKSPLAWINYLGKILSDWHDRGECEYLKGSSFTKPEGFTAPETKYWKATGPVDPTYYRTGPEKERLIAEYNALHPHPGTKEAPRAYTSA